ncbi:MAG: nucleotidyltransferase family protein [Chlorobiales bacterium]|nr:nucleotidyltransferase family protein [Chlorobiales bacterium]
MIDKDQITEIIQANQELLQKFFVRSVAVFGSVVRKDAGPESDADILVEFEPGAEIGLFEFVQLKNTLSDLLSTGVDLVTPDALHPALKDRILSEARRVA